jgi:hypothetical protein
MGFRQKSLAAGLPPSQVWGQILALAPLGERENGMIYA